METFVLSIPKSFPSRGLGAGSFEKGYWGGRSIPLASPNSGSLSVAAPVASSNGAPAVNVTRPGRRGIYSLQSDSSFAYGTTPPVGQASASPSAATIAAFQSALSNASMLGVISPVQAGTIQSQAAGLTDAHLQTLTSHINSLVASTPSAGTVAAANAAASAASAAAVNPAAAPPSWWNGTTTLFGSVVNNSTLAISGIVATLAYFAFKKK